MTVILTISQKELAHLRKDVVLHVGLPLLSLVVLFLPSQHSHSKYVRLFIKRNNILSLVIVEIIDESGIPYLLTT